MGEDGPGPEKTDGKSGLWKAVDKYGAPAYFIIVGAIYVHLFLRTHRRHPPVGGGADGRPSTRR